MTRLVALLFLWLALPSWALAQTPVVLRLDGTLGGLASSVVAGVERRTQRVVRVGDALDDTTPRDLGPTTIGIARTGEQITLFAMAGSGRLHESAIGAAPDDRATARVIVVAISTFLDALDADATPPEIVPPPPTPAPPVEEPLEDLAPPYAPDDFVLGFVLEVRERIGYATQRDQGHAATGVSAGVCFGTWWCLLLDADAMAPEEDHALSVGGLSYQSTLVGVGARFLPLEAGPVRGGVGLDAMMRIARVWTDAPVASDLSLSASTRLYADVAVRLAGPVSLALEAGADIALNGVAYRRASRLVFQEDIVTLWAALALRIGPF